MDNDNYISMKWTIFKALFLKLTFTECRQKWKWKIRKNKWRLGVYVLKFLFTVQSVQHLRIFNEPPQLLIVALKVAPIFNITLIPVDLFIYTANISRKLSKKREPRDLKFHAVRVCFRSHKFSTTTQTSFTAVTLKPNLVP